jgi:shikimate kinase
VKPVVLIGPPGAGKTTIGVKLAKLMGRRFLDTDRMVEEQTGQSIGEIFTGQGEAHFRDLERRAVAQAMTEAASQDLVIALGGGAPLDPVSAEMLRREATVVFLDVSPVVAARRVGLNDARPLLRESPRKVWRELMAQRRPVYEALADRTVVVDGLMPGQVAARIARLVRTTKVAK